MTPTAHDPATSTGNDSGADVGVVVSPAGVLIPADLAGALLDLLATTGRPVSRRVRAILEALAVAETISLQRNQPGPPGRLEPVGAPRWCTTTQAATESGLSIRRVQQLASTGRIEARRLDGTRIWLIDQASLTQHLAEQPDDTHHPHPRGGS